MSAPTQSAGPDPASKTDRQLMENGYQCRFCEDHAAPSQRSIEDPQPCSPEAKSDGPDPSSKASSARTHAGPPVPKADQAVPSQASTSEPPAQRAGPDPASYTANAFTGLEMPIPRADHAGPSHVATMLDRFAPADPRAPPASRTEPDTS